MYGQHLTCTYQMDVDRVLKSARSNKIRKWGGLTNDIRMQKD